MRAAVRRDVVRSHHAFSGLAEAHSCPIHSMSAAQRPIRDWFDGRFVLIGWKRFLGWVRRIGSHWLGVRCRHGCRHGCPIGFGFVRAKRGHGLPLLPVMLAAACAELCTTISTRRLLARPSGVSLDATGLASPRPMARIFSCFTP